MEKHRCKLCFKSFANGRALGGHMRSHVMNLYTTTPPKSQPPLPPNFDDEDQFFNSVSSSFSSSSSSEEENEERESLIYGLRENPKKSIKLVDPEFSFAGGGGSVVLIQDIESETESSKNPIRRRSKRVRKSGNSGHHHHQCNGEKAAKKGKSLKLSKAEPPRAAAVEAEPVSSISDTSPEEDVAYCLMMLSRDKWRRENEEEDEEQEDDDQSREFDELKTTKNRVRGKYKCETCSKVFKSYQALGGHRASHKKGRINTNGVSISSSTHDQLEALQAKNEGIVEEKIHQCPVCFRVFSSGQALGGHKRTHVVGSTPAATTTATKEFSKPPLKFSGKSLIDLNLPAPIDDDDEEEEEEEDGEISQIEISAVSDAEFVRPIKH